MDPVTAFGLAAGILQFVQFSSGLLKSSVQIYKAARPTTSASDCLELRAVCDRLSKLSSALCTHPQAPQQPSQNEKFLWDLAKSCQKDCEELLKKLQELRASDSRQRFWTCFREALKDSFGGTSHSFTQLQGRIKAYESSMQLHMCAAIIESGKRLQDTLDKFRKDHASSVVTQDGRLRGLETTITQILDELRRSHAASQTASGTDSEMNQLVTQLRTLSIESVDLENSQRILASLEYDKRPVRHESIADAHTKTFEWALKRLSTPDSTQAPDRKTGQGDIFEWLERGAGLFWVSGKPGSGKSTLMKFLADHRTTQTTLASWAGQQPLIIASHYFWVAGTEMQKSERGLLQSLLLEILEQAPQIASEICKEQFDENRGFSHRSRGPTKLRPWSVAELRNCLQQVANRPDIRVCIFIDGLDELGGEHHDHLDMATFLKQLAQSPTLKICVSSRPWNAFEHTFGNSLSSKIYMQELTRADVLEFARSRLTEHPRWAHTVPPDKGEELIQEIATEAQGVFLWVRLVVNLLRKELANGDTIQELRATLNSLPRELKPFYQHMLDSVESVYHEKMSGMLHLALYTYYLANFKICHFFEMEYEDVDYALKLRPEKIDDEWCDRVRLEVVGRLDALCKGLLEINGVDEVVFIHRTVSDWLRTKSTRDYLSQKSRPGSNITLSLLRAMLAWFKHPRGPEDAFDPLIYLDHHCKLADSVSRLKDQESPQISHIYQTLDAFIPVTAALAGMGMIERKESHHLRPSNAHEEQPYLDPFIQASILMQTVFIHHGFWDYLHNTVLSNPDSLLFFLHQPAYIEVYYASELVEASHDYGIRDDTTSDREKAVRSTITTYLLGSLIKDFIPPFRRHACERQEAIPMRTNNLNEALWLIGRLLCDAGADPDTIHIPTARPTKAEIQAWAGLLFLPLTERFLDSSSTWEDHFLPNVLPIILRQTVSESYQGDSRLMLLQYDPGVTIWDLLCEQVAALQSQDPPCSDDGVSPQEFLVKHLIRAFSKAETQLPWQKLQTAVKEGFPDDSSERLTELMEELGLVDADEVEDTDRESDDGGGQEACGVNEKPMEDSGMYLAVSAPLRLGEPSGTQKRPSEEPEVAEAPKKRTRIAVSDLLS